MRSLVLKTEEDSEWFFGSLLSDPKVEGWFPARLVKRSRPVRGELAGGESFNSSFSEGGFPSSNNLMSPPSVTFNSASLAEFTAQQPAADVLLECIKVCRVTVDYDKPSEPTHLSVKDGDIVAVYSEADAFAKCYTLDGRMGTLPSKVPSFAFFLV